MSDINDFTRSLASVITTLEERIREGVEQPGSFSIIFKSSIASYELPRSAIDVIRVTGFHLKTFTVFQSGRDYTFSANRLNFIPEGTLPDDTSRVDIEFTFREERSGLTDFNPGSVVGTLLRAVSRELTVLYAQMDEAYRRAFIDEATGVALDNVVALLGIVRTPALKSKGFVTFLRKKPATQTVVIPAGTRVADKDGRVFVTTEEGKILTEFEEVRTPAGTTVRTTNKIAELLSVVLKDAVQPAPEIPRAAGFGPEGDERTITFIGAPPVADVLIRYKPKSVTVPIEAADPGPQGDVNANTIVVMPTPPRDVDAVTNEDATAGGQNPEADIRLRERAKHALERAGNATPDAIKFAVLEVKGVQGVEVLDHARDDAIPLGEVRVRYSGGDLNDVRRAVERTRAAGVIAQVEEITTVFISGTFFVIPEEQPSPAASGAFVQEVSESLEALAIGAPVAIRRLNSLVFQVPGLADVAEAQLLSHKPAASSPGVNIASDPLILTASEMARPKKGEIKVVALAKIVAATRTTVTPGTTYSINLQIQSDQGSPAAFRSFKVDIQVTARTKLLEQPTQPPVRVGLFVKSVTFTSATAPLTFTVATDLPDFRAANHDHNVTFTLAAAAYPALQSGSITFDVTT
jgi:uncharacterized phage protein gp47/JayE